MSPIFELLQTFRDVTSVIPPRHASRHALQTVEDAIRTEQRFLSAVQDKYPQSLMQTIVNSSAEAIQDGLDDGVGALKTFSASWIEFNNELARPWIRMIKGGTRPRTRSHLREFPAPVRAIAVSTTANQLAIASGRKIYVETLATGEQLFCLDGHRSTSTDRSKDVWSMGYTPDGRFLVSTAERICVWNSIDGSLLHEFGETTHHITRIAVSPTGKRVARTAGEIVEYDIEAGERVRGLSYGETVAYSPTLPYIASGTSSGTVVLFDSITGEVVRKLPAHSGWVCALAFSLCGRYLATGSWDWTASVWDLEEMELVALFKGHSGSVESVAFTHDSQYVITASNDRTVRRWSVGTQAVVDSYDHKAEVRTVSVEPSSNCIYSGGEDRYLVMMPVTAISHVELWGSEGDGDNKIEHLTTNLTRKLFATTSGAKVNVWNAMSGECIGTYLWRESMFGKFFWSHFSPDGLSLVVATAGGSILAVDLSTGKERQLTACFDEDGAIEMEFSSNSRFLIVSAHKELRLFRTADWEMIKHLDGRQAAGAAIGVRYERNIWVSDDCIAFGTSNKTWHWDKANESWMGTRLDASGQNSNQKMTAVSPRREEIANVVANSHRAVCDENGVRVDLDRPLWLSGFPDHLEIIGDTIICVRVSNVSIGKIQR